MKLRSKVILRMFIIVSLGILLSGCGLGSNNDYSGNNANSEEYKDDSGTLGEYDDSNEKEMDIPEVQRKIIKTAYVRMETLNFDESLNKVNREVEKIGGYIESSNATGASLRHRERERYADLVLRIPSDKFDYFLNSLGDVGNIVEERESGEDVTSQYIDTEARVNTLKVQEERMLELLKEAKDLKDILEIEKHLSEVRYEIEKLTGSLKNWDNLVSYSTISISINEVDEFYIAEQKPKTLLDKMGIAFKDSIGNIVDMCKNTVIFIVSLIPYLVILLPVILVIRHILNKKGIKLFGKEE